MVQTQQLVHFVSPRNNSRTINWKRKVVSSKEKAGFVMSNYGPHIVVVPSHYSSSEVKIQTRLHSQTDHNLRLFLNMLPDGNIKYLAFVSWITRKDKPKTKGKILSIINSLWYTFSSKFIRAGFFIVSFFFTPFLWINLILQKDGSVKKTVN